jgi:hypothetical protein
MDPKVQQQLLDDLTKQSNKINQLLSSHAPAAWQAILDVTRFQGISYLFYGLICIILGVIASKVSPWLWRQGYNDTELEPLYFTTFWFTAFGGLAVFTTGVCMFFNIWNWVSVFNPQIYLLHDVIEKVTRGN